jgi:hypothetical protein
MTFAEADAEDALRYLAMTPAAHVRLVLVSSPCP